jgi:hypothetical protein
MNVKDKAEQLIDKYKPLVTTWDCYHDTERDEDLVLRDAIKCALIAVDEIISSLEITTGHCELRRLDYQEVQRDFQYWNDVKTFLTIKTPITK